MDNTNNEQSIAELMLATARKSVIITNLSLSEAMETGMMVQYESFGQVPCVCVMGLRQNSTALICCNDGDSNKIYLQYVAIEKENGFHLKYNTQIYNNNQPITGKPHSKHYDFWRKSARNEQCALLTTTVR